MDATSKRAEHERAAQLAMIRNMHGMTLTLNAGANRAQPGEQARAKPG
jgi:hypothetical protein